MISRQVLDDLRDWRGRDDRKPLVLRGARQVGKTTAVDLFGAEFRQYVSLNLDHPGDREIFDRELPDGLQDAMAEVPCADYAVAPLRRLFRDYVLIGGPTSAPCTVAVWRSTS